ncbi:MAG: methyl-coenzyme M reductase family protein [Candidatus Methanofastidiosia archaeon]
MFKIYVFKGGIYRHDEIIEKIEDFGGIVMQKIPMQTEINIIFALPEIDLKNLGELAKKLKGEINYIPFGDTEIAIVSPSLSRHHLPHPVCDISEFLRRYGATTNIVGLARGYGKTIFQISDKEKRIIAEHDAAIFSYGLFEECIVMKTAQTKTVDIPYVICGGPSTIESVENYVGKIGRKAIRMRTSEDIASLEDIKKLLLEMIEARRKEISKDPPPYPPAYIKREMENQLKIKGSLGDNPVVLHLNGLRVKLPYKDYFNKIKKITIRDHELGNIARISRSEMNDTLLIKLLSTSELREVKS